MLADVSLLLHEINDAVRFRRGSRVIGGVTPRSDARPATVFVTGLASIGKARLVEALCERLAAGRIAVRTEAPFGGNNPTFHVHAETDIEALIEGGIKVTSKAGTPPDLIVPVDWESTDRSVRRVLEALTERGLADGEAGV